MRSLRAFLSCAATAAILIPCGAPAQEAAGNFPTRPVTIILPQAPGGPTDAEVRLYMPKLSALLGQTFLADYKPGASSTIALAYVAKSKPDGYTLIAVSLGFTVIPAFYKDLPFDTIKDLAPVTLASQAPFVLLVSPSFPAKTFAEYIAYAKANPGKISFGTAGAGGIAHLGGAWMHTASNSKVTFVHYKGSAPLMLDLTAGRIDVASATPVSTLPMIKSGKLRALAITDAKRTSLLPGVPTIAEQGMPDFSYANWLGFVTTGGTPAPIVGKLSDAFARMVKAPDMVAALEPTGSVPVGNTPAQFRQMIITETERWRKVVQDNGIKMEE